MPVCAHVRQFLFASTAVADRKIEDGAEDQHCEEHRHDQKKVAADGPLRERKWMPVPEIEVVYPSKLSTPPFARAHIAPNHNQQERAANQREQRSRGAQYVHRQ